VSDNATGLSFVLGGVEYRADDLTLLDVAEIEDAHEDTIQALVESGRMTPLLHIVLCIRRHSEPGVTMEDIGNVTLGALVAEAQEAGGPPTEAGGPTRKVSGRGGGRGSRSATASARGKSGS